MTLSPPPRANCWRCRGAGSVLWLEQRVPCACLDETFTERGGPPFEIRLPIETPWHEAQRMLLEMAGAYFEDGANDWSDTVAINLAVAGMLAGAARCHTPGACTVSALIPCPCGCGLRTNGTTRCAGCGRDISNAHWDGLYESCGDCADIAGMIGDNHKVDLSAWASVIRKKLPRERTPGCGW